MRAGIPRRIGNFTAASFLIFLLIVLLVLPVNINYSSQTVEEEQFPQVELRNNKEETIMVEMNQKVEMKEVVLREMNLSKKE